MKIPLSDGVVLEGVLEGVLDGLGLDGDAAIVCHPHPAFGGRMDNPLVVELARGLVARGVPALRFHFRGVEGSGGEATGGRLEEEDVLAATRFLLAEGARRVAWLGYSFGALMAWKAIAAGARPFAYVGIALPTSIIGDDPERRAAAARAAEVPVPGLLLSGARDPLCDAGELRAWTARGRHMRVETLPDEAHVFSFTAQRRVVERAVAFIEEARS